MTRHTEEIALAFDMIRRYAERENWIPIGFKVFTVGPWTVTVNGTNSERDKVPPYHAMVAHNEIISLMLLSPFGGTVGGWKDSEDAFIRDMETELEG